MERKDLRDGQVITTGICFMGITDIALGDGATDDTIALKLSFAFAATLGRVLFIPAGSYIVTDTIHVSPEVGRRS